MNSQIHKKKEEEEKKNRDISRSNRMTKIPFRPKLNQGQRHDRS